MFKIFASLFFTIIFVVSAIEFTVYNNKQVVSRIIAEPITDTELPLVSIDTLITNKILTITATNDLGQTVTVTINTKEYQSDDNRIDSIGNSSTCWTGAKSDQWYIETNNSTITHIGYAPVIESINGSINGWYKVTSVLYEIKNQ